MMNTPWGPSQQTKRFSNGIVRVDTAGHGGYYVPAELQSQMPECYRKADGWYEEDCEWAMVAVSFPDFFAPATVVDADRTLRNWYPTQWEEVNGRTLLPGESMVKDEQKFFEDHAKDWLAVVAFGDWHEHVPQGMVGVGCVKGGRDPKTGSCAGREMRNFLVPEDDYVKLPGQYAFIADPTRHGEWNFPAKP
jgi:hypothetical protein